MLAILLLCVSSASASENNGECIDYEMENTAIELVVTVTAGSAAEQYCIDNQVNDVIAE